MKTISVVAAALLTTTAATAAEKPPVKLTYDEHILPLLKDKCLSCHNADKVKGGLDASSYAKLMEGGGGGAAVVPGNPDKSRLFLVMAHKEEPFMPPRSPKLAMETLDLVRTWIEKGALENSGSKTPTINKPKVDIALTSISRGRPEGPMPSASLSLDPLVKAARANAVTALATSPWAPLVAVGSPKQVLLYNTDTLELLGVLPFGAGVPHVLKFSRNGGLLLAGGGRGGKTGQVVVYNVRTGEAIFEVGDETDAVLAADISADQTQIALGGPSRVVRVYSTRDGKLLREIRKHTDWIYAIEYSPDGVLLATADRSSGLFVWEAFTGREFFSLRGHTAAILDVSWRDDSNVLASTGEDGTVRLWEMENGNLIKSWPAHGGGSQAVRFSHDDRLVSAGRDRLVKLWDIAGTQQRAFEAFGDVAMRAAITHDNARAIGGDWTGELRIWAAADGKRLGTLSTNPPSQADRLAAAEKVVAELDAAAAKAKADLAAAQVIEKKAVQDLEAAKQAATAAATASKAAGDAVVAIQTQGQKAQQDATGARNKVAALDVLAKANADRAAAIKAAADKAKDNPDLAALVTVTQQESVRASADLAAAQKASAEAAGMAQKAADQLAAAQKAANDTKAAQAAAEAAIAPRTQAAQAATVPVKAAQAAAEQAVARATAARTELERLKSLRTAASSGK